MTQIKLTIEMPEPGPIQHAEKLSIEDEIRDCLDCIMSGHDSKREWKVVNKVYRELKAKSNPSKRVQDLIAMIDPVLNKFGYHGVGTGE